MTRPSVAINPIDARTLADKLAPMAQVQKAITHEAEMARKQDDPLQGIWDSDAEQKRLAQVFERAFLRVLRAVHAVVARGFPQARDFRLDDSATNRVLLQAATRVVRIDNATRQAIVEQLRIGQERGYSSWEIAHGVEKDGYRGIDGLFKETWASRAETVARTEMQEAQRLSAIDRYQATGLVDRVQIRDGDFDPACQARDGRIVPIEQVPGLLHPNCRMILMPVQREGL